MSLDFFGEWVMWSLFSEDAKGTSSSLLVYAASFVGFYWLAFQVRSVVDFVTRKVFRNELGNLSNKIVLSFEADLGPPFEKQAFKEIFKVKLLKKG